MFPTPTTEFFQFQFLLNFPFVFVSIVINPFAFGTLKFYDVFLTHKISGLR